MLGPYLDDLDRLNALAGGYWLTLRMLRRLMRREARPARVADVGGGRGDLAVRIARDARARGRRVTVIVVDRDETSLVMGARAHKDSPDICWVQADAAALPLRPGAVDVAVTSLTLHHLAPDAVVKTLAGMRRAARCGVIVNDLIRERIPFVLCWLATKVFARHPFARHDGPLSLRRAYTAGELRGLARLAGLVRLDVRHYRLLARLIAVGR